MYGGTGSTVSPLDAKDPVRHVERYRALVTHAVTSLLFS